MAIHDGKVARAMTQDFTEDERYPNTSENGGAIESPKLDKLYRLVGIVVVVSVFAGIVLWLRPFSSSGNHLSQLAKEDFSGLGNVEEVTGIRNPAKPVVDWKAKEEIAVNKAAIVELQEKLDLLLKKSIASSEQLAGLKSKLLDLRTSRAGFKLASDEDSVIRFIGLEEKIGALTGEFPASNLFATEMKSLLSDVETRGDSSYSPDPFVVK
ncbi:MAG: hypothetical protein AAF623_21180, partial [Planctomycetota bacterium]